LSAECFVTDLLEEASLKRARVVDESVDTAEPCDGRINGGLRRDGVGTPRRPWGINFLARLARHRSLALLNASRLSCVPTHNPHHFG
jgi:hypothetical protein